MSRGASALIALTGVVLGGIAFAASPPPTPTAVPTPGTIQSPGQAMIEQEEAALSGRAYTYDPAGRRDPFLNLLGSGTNTNKGPVRRVDGPAGMSIGEISVRGIMQSRGAYLAMIQGPDKKNYIVRQGDKLLDGTIKTITALEIVVLQDVNDPLSLVKTREVHKPLRTIEDAKE